ncbi:MAG: preprotein translocase subunit SecE [Clostridia bacterium]|nr:preprotein translocase subunit SecE [Clostridia bacterium]
MTKNTPAKSKENKPGIFAKIGNWFKNVGIYIKDVFSETKKLSWPSKKEVINYTLAVIGFVALMALIIWVLDLAFSKGIQALASIKIG